MKDIKISELKQALQERQRLENSPAYKMEIIKAKIQELREVNNRIEQDLQQRRRESEPIQVEPYRGDVRNYGTEPFVGYRLTWKDKN